MSKSLNVEVEGGELALKNSNGDVVIIPKKDRVKVEKLIKDKCWGCIDSFVDDLPLMEDYAEDGTIVSQLYTEKTGKDWSEAKSSGLTSGSYQDNMNLRDRLLKGDFDNIEKPNTSLNPSTPVIETTNKKTVSYENAKNFNEAFAIAREQLGANQIFEYQGRKYGTNLKGEDFQPTEEALNKYGLNTTETKERIGEQNKAKSSVYTTKQTTKLEPEYQDWDKVKKRKEEYNSMTEADKIIKYKSENNDGKNYVVVDKKKGLVHIYKAGESEPLFTSAIDLGHNKGDAQTVTKYKDFDGDGKITDKDKKDGKFVVDWNAGNMTTGAGRYVISNVDDKGYGGLPILNMMNESQYGEYLKNGKVNNVATSFHKGYIKDDDFYTYSGRPEAKYKKEDGQWLIKLESTKGNYVPLKDPDGTRAKVLEKEAVKANRVSNGCVRCNKPTLQQLSKNITAGSEVYILPEDENNTFEYENGQLNFKSNNKTDFYSYKDNGNIYKKEDGKWLIAPKGVGNAFVPIKDPEGTRTKELDKNATNLGYNVYMDGQGIARKGQGVNKTVNTLNYKPIKISVNKDKFAKEKDPQDGARIKGVDNFVSTLAGAKQAIMKKASINGDVYNEIAKITTGILGVESDFANRNSLGKDVILSLIGKRPSTQFESDYRGEEGGKAHSIGLTQVVWNILKHSEKEALAEFGIESQTDFNSPDRAAFGTALILAMRYNDEVKGRGYKGEDELQKIASTWNKASNYYTRVKKAQRFFTLKELN